MRKIVLFFVFLIAGQAIANDFIFDKKYYQCENKWVVLPKSDTDNSYLTGVVYLDRAAGFTFSYEGDITLKDGKYTFKGIENSTHMIHRLPQNFALIAIIPDNVIKNLGLPKEPSWLDVYRKGEDETDALVRRGWHFNHVGGSDLAIPILLKAYAKNPHAESLEFELSYAYNATGQFEKAIEVLTKAIKHDDKNFWFLRELGYAYIHLDKLADAEKTYNKGIAMATEKMQQAEMGYNMTSIYFQKNNRKKFDEWLAVTKKYPEEGFPYYEPLMQMEANFGK